MTRLFLIDECFARAREIKEYENEFLTHQISFLETVHEYFTVRDLGHEQEIYDIRMRRFFSGEPLNVMVYHAGELEEHQIIKLR